MMTYDSLVAVRQPRCVRRVVHNTHMNKVDGSPPFDAHYTEEVVV